MKRYKLVHDPEYMSQMMVRPDGKFVLYDDHEAAITAAQDEIARLRAALVKIRDAKITAFRVEVNASAGCQHVKHTGSEDYCLASDVQHILQIAGDTLAAKHKETTK